MAESLELWFLTYDVVLDWLDEGGENTISRKDRNIRNNLVKFAVCR